MPIARLNDENKGIAIITSGNEDDSEDISFCENCQLYRKKNIRLVPLITLEDEVPPPDADQFKQCPSCYKIIPLYDVITEGTLYTDIEGVKNKFEFGITKIEGIDNKKLKDQIKSVKKKSRKEEYSSDQEVMNEVKQGAVVTAYYTNNTN